MLPPMEDIAPNGRFSLELIMDQKPQGWRGSAEVKVIDMHEADLSSNPNTALGILGISGYGPRGPLALPGWPGL